MNAEKPVDVINFYAENNSLGFIETPSRRFDFMPEIPTVKGRQYIVELYADARIIVKEELDDGWKTLVDAPPDEYIGHEKQEG